MDVEDVVIEAKALRPKSHQRIMTNFCILLGKVVKSVMLRGPYRLVLDSNIIMRPESYQQGNITEVVLSMSPNLVVKRG